MKIEIEIPDDTAMYVNRLVALANTGDIKPLGDLTITSLVEMLVDDCALVVRRPGCWEAVGMSQLLTSHGYEI